MSLPSSQNTRNDPIAPGKVESTCPPVSLLTVQPQRCGFGHPSIKEIWDREADGNKTATAESGISRPTVNTDDSRLGRPVEVGYHQYTKASTFQPGPNQPSQMQTTGTQSSGMWFSGMQPGPFSATPHCKVPSAMQPSGIWPGRTYVSGMQASGMQTGGAYTGGMPSSRVPDGLDSEIKRITADAEVSSATRLCADHEIDVGSLRRISGGKNRNTSTALSQRYRRSTLQDGYQCQETDS